MDKRDLLPASNQVGASFSVYTQYSSTEDHVALQCTLTTFQNINPHVIFSLSGS